MRLLSPCSLLRLVAPLILGLFLAGRSEAQFYTLPSRWTINAAGAPAPLNPYLVLDEQQWAGFAPRLSAGVVGFTPFPWTTMTVTQTAGPAPLFAPITITNGVPGCNLVADSACANLPANPQAGIYTATAVVNPGGLMAVLTIVVGGGAGPAVAGTQVFGIVGNSTGVPYSYGLSLGNANPAMVPLPGQPIGAGGAAFAAALAASINAGGAGYVAVAAGPLLAITAPGAAAFRLWVGDGVGNPTCQVTGGACEFNPQIADITHSTPVPAMPTPAVAVLVVLGLAVGLYGLGRRQP